MPRVLLIDGDWVVYKTCAAVETDLDWGDGLWTLHSDAYTARSMVGMALSQFMETFHGDDIIIGFSDPTGGNFRKALLPTYKQNRAGKRKPLAYADTVQWVLDNYTCFHKPGLEGDDVLGILATVTNLPLLKQFNERLVVSVDKDFRQIPGLIADPESGDVTPVSELDADYWHMVQTLTGDSTDGYSGCPGIGPKKADALLAEHRGDIGAMWSAVVKAYEKAGLSEAVALVQARVARICRAEDYDFLRKEARPWQNSTL